MRAVKITTFIILILCGQWKLSAQGDTRVRPLTKMATGVIVGANYSELYFQNALGFPGDTILRRHRGNIGPVIGFQVQTSPTYRMDLKAAIQLAFRGVSASDTEHPKIRNTYIDVEIAPRWRVHDQLVIETGVELNLMLSSTHLFIDGTQPNGIGKDLVEYYGNTFHPYLAAYVPFSDKLEFGAKWSIPIHGEDYTNIETKFVYKLYQDFYYPAEKGPKDGKDLGTEEIMQLKVGHLVVVLEDKAAEIENYRKAGKDALALELRNEQQKSRQTIIRVFRESFDFCPVYFTTSDQQAQLDAGLFDKIVYLDEDGNKDPTIRPMTPEFLFARFEDIGPSSAGEGVDYSLWYLDKKTVEDLQMSGSETTRYKAFIFFDREMKDLRSPFPYKIQQYDYVFIEEDYKLLINEIDQSLSDHFGRVEKEHRKRNR